MGRYYNGDIEGKFWFAVQSSDDADFFGSKGAEPCYLEYNFEEEDLPKIREGVQKCIKALGKYKDVLDKYFFEHDGYNDDAMAKEIKVTTTKLKTLLVWYARLELGEKILKCVEENGECNFTAEL